MPGKQTTASDSEAGKIYLTKCHCTGIDCMPYPLWTQVLLPTKPQEIPIKAIPVRFLLCRKTTNEPLKSDVSQEDSLRGPFKPMPLDNMDGETMIGFFSVIEQSREDVYEKWLILHKKQLLLS